PTVTVYDVLDRATSVTLPDNSTTTTAYTVDNGSHALVTTVTDALHNVQATHTNGGGKTLKTIQKSGPDGEITTSFEYDGIQRLVRVTDTEGNVTTSTYDMGDRRTEVNHPASGITSFTYDALGNVLTKQTANLAKEGKFITYDYDYQRLTGINYPDHPENNVKYYYGGRNASQNRIGRLMLREDGTGAIEYFYGKMGEVTKTRRTMIVPNQAIATYVTQWTYDSHNRLLEMIYPDEEKITYSYNLGGQLEKVHGYKSYGYDYVSKIGYDKFEQRTYLKYCNGAETFYTYDPQRRRLQNLTVNSGGNTIMDNAYTYDAVSNVLSVVNGASVPQSGKAGGQMAHAYTYDALYRLVGATGTYTGADNKTASYTLAMGYDNMHRITSKRQILTQNNVQFNGTLNAGYDLSYTYGTETGKKFQLANVKDVNYRTEETPSESENVNNSHVYEYDANGNLVYVNTSRTKKDGVADEKTAERKLKWDEENRLLASDDNGFVTNYWYDADGERTVKTSGESDQVYVNSEFAGGRTNTAKFSLYVSPYLVANQGGRYTKHIYIGSQRIVSKIGDFDSYGSDPRRIQYAGSETDGLSVDYKVKYAGQLQVIKDNYATFAVPYNGEDNNDYVDGKGFCCNDGSLEAAQARAMAANIAKAKAVNGNFKENDDYEKMQFYYHPDHLGSSSYITNLDGEVVQHIEYVPFGEVFIEERNDVWNTPYLFNAKEFDEETGMYYYGARYYDPHLSLWMSTDALKEKVPNVSSYAYTENNPITYVDPDGNFRWKWLAQWSRKWHNLWHKNKASEIMENKNAKNPYFRYTYQVGSVENGEVVVTLHYKIGKEFVQTAQDVGDAVSVAGYACTLSVVGAEIGVPLAAFGNEISGAFGATEFGIDLINGDFSNNKKSFIYYSAEFLIEKILGKILPGFGKKLGEKGFDLGTEIVTQGTRLKETMVERTVDEVIERKKENAQPDSTTVEQFQPHKDDKSNRLTDD
ncbi:RHS repeat-associated core domain-containing protein, partial [Segatella sp.]|uniref:RHS repeat-associated core domain-containing protein n=1 Tax=Segatella sp. TaxID=2974253 RepID=UPI003AAE59FE